MNNISYDEILTMMYLSLLIYDYSSNSDFVFKENQTIQEYLISVNKKYINGINDINLSKLETNGLLYLNNNFSDGKVIAFIDNLNIQLAIILSESLKVIVIVFRGTDSFKDLLYDCYISKTYLDENIYIHSGFYNQLNTIYGELLNIIDNYLTNDYNIYISGHSAGGAHSTIFSYLLSKKTNKLIKVITFGCPKIGNYEWKLSYELKKNILNYRITNNNDIITSVPIYNYYHVGVNIHLTNTNILYNNTNYNFFKYIYLIIDNICDHCLVKYYENLINKEDKFIILMIENHINPFMRFNSDDTNNNNLINNLNSKNEIINL